MSDASKTFRDRQQISQVRPQCSDEPQLLLFDCIYIYTHVCIYIHNIYVCMCVYVCICMSCVYKCIYLSVCINACICVCVYTVYYYILDLFIYLYDPNTWSLHPPRLLSHSFFCFLLPSWHGMLVFGIAMVTIGAFIFGLTTTNSIYQDIVS